VNIKKLQPAIIFILGLTLLMCNNEPHTIKPSSAEEQRIQENGEKAVGVLLKIVQKELKTTIEEKGLVAALSVCDDKALYLTDSVANSMNGVLEIKRTSLRYRNPENAPDTYERNVLSYFQSTLLETGNLPEDMIEKVSSDTTTHFRYYRPLVVKSLCLNCHGQSENISPEVAYRLKRLYPKDHATGYSIDQFRGVVRVSIR